MTYPTAAVDSDEQKALVLSTIIELDGNLSKQELEFADDAARRYLRARKGDVKKAASLLLSTLHWRKEIQMGTLRIGEFEDELKSGKMYVAGCDRHGRSVLITRKKSDKFQQGSFDHYMRHLAFTLETSVRAMQHGQEQWVWIMDMAGYSRANSPPLSVSLATLRVLADHFPERLAACYMVDAPSIFSWLWSALSPFIDPVTKHKVKFITSTNLPLSSTEASTGATPSLQSASQHAPADAAVSVTASFGADAVAQSHKSVGGKSDVGDAFKHLSRQLSHPPPPDFSDYVSFYKAPYDEATFRSLLAQCGWPA